MGRPVRTRRHSTRRRQPINEAAKKALETPEAKARGAAQGVEVRFLGQEALAALVKRETDYWTKVIKSRNITAD